MIHLCVFTLCLNDSPRRGYQGLTDSPARVHRESQWFTRACSPRISMIHLYLFTVSLNMIHMARIPWVSMSHLGVFAVRLNDSPVRVDRKSQ